MTTVQRKRWARTRRLGPVWFSLLVGGLGIGLGSAAVWAGLLAFFGWLIESPPAWVWLVPAGFLVAGVPVGVCGWFVAESAYRRPPESPSASS